MDDVDTRLRTKGHLQDLGSCHESVAYHENDITNITKTVRKLPLFPDTHSGSRLHESRGEGTEFRSQDNDIRVEDSADDEVEDDLIRS